ncbi:MAG: DUF397 domain-containing protein [Umezawaea sp.]
MDLNWHKSSYSGNSTGNCVELALTEQGAAVRDSKNPTGPRLDFPATAWRAFVADLPG